MVHKPTYKLPFGINKGFTLAQVFQFTPSYLLWLIEYVDDFEIDLSEFEKLPIPTPYKRSYEPKGKGLFFGRNELLVKSALDYVSEGGALKEKPFVFSDKIISILEEKKRGTYQTPTLEKPNTISADKFVKIAEKYKPKNPYNFL